MKMNCVAILAVPLFLACVLNNVTSEDSLWAEELWDDELWDEEIAHPRNLDFEVEAGEDNLDEIWSREEEASVLRDEDFPGVEEVDLTDTWDQIIKDDEDNEDVEQLRDEEDSMVLRAEEVADPEDPFATAGQDLGPAGNNSSPHAGCIAGWATLNQNTDDKGCPKKKAMRKFVKKCKVKGLKKKIRKMKKKCGGRGGKKKKTFMKVTTVDVTPVDSGNSTNSRKKRFVVASPNKIWTGGKVPYLVEGGSQSTRRAMNTFERYTCLRFIPWEKKGGVTTNEELGLDHPSYLKFVYEGGCWADLGNVRRSSGQKVSCCGGVTCLHEVGHAMGAFHEHQNPLGKGVIRLNPENAQDSKRNNFKDVMISPSVYTDGFDMTSVMGYGKTTFSNGNGQVISYDFSDVKGGNEWFYLMKEISATHKCAELYCSDFTMECVNDGYLSQIDGECGCMCPPGLDPVTGCATVLGDADNDAIPARSKWPVGQYALPMAKDGCPDDVFSEGSVTETGGKPGSCKDKTKRGCKYWFKAYGCDANQAFMHDQCPAKCKVCWKYGNHKSTVYDLAGDVSEKKVEHKVCTKTDTSGDDDAVQWPPGQYCIYRVGGECPAGFDSGSVKFSDSGSGSKSGKVPDGDFGGKSTKFEFCCTKYGFMSDELVFPRTKPFALFKAPEKDDCHAVRGMHVYDGATIIKNAKGSPTIKGDTPVVEDNDDSNTWAIPYCYYVPTEKDCGGEIELSEENPLATIGGDKGKEQVCNWIIKSPPQTRIMMKVDKMNIATDEDGDCVDSLIIGTNRLAQPGHRYCGMRLEKVISTVNNTMKVTFETHREGKSSFSATIALISQSNLCYSVGDRGRTYRGTVDRTRGLKTCIPWAQAAHCPHNPFTDADMVDGLQDNYCRNPELSDGLRPWCYTEAEGCQRDYCDVCQLENLYDILSNRNCEIMAKLGTCDNDPDVQAKCAGTCSKVIKQFPTPKLESEISCPAPSEVSDGKIVGDVKSSYKVGDVVTYACKDGRLSSKERYCLTTGEWSSLNFVCTECELGWSHYEGMCYKSNRDEVEHDEAVAKCAESGATLIMPKTRETLDYLASLDYWYGSWLGATDKVKEDKWVWDDGEAFSYKNWASGQPDNYYNEDCVWMHRDGEMEDRWCKRDTKSYICQKPENPVDNCDDVTDDCVNFYSNKPNACSSQSDFMSRNCKKTCGMCGSAASCSVEAPSSDAELVGDSSSISQGGYVEYKCKSGAGKVSGDEVRGCLQDGTLTGEQLVCSVKAGVSVNDAVMEKFSPWGSKKATGKVYTGKIPGMVIPKDGKITQWVFWSSAEGKPVFQVWRPTGNSDKLKFVGQNQAPMSPEDATATFYVEEQDQISVQKGDYLGVYYPDKNQAVGYTEDKAGCKMGPVKALKKKNKSGKFKKGDTYAFKSEKKEKCRIYRFNAIVE